MVIEQLAGARQLAVIQRQMLVIDSACAPGHHRRCRRELGRLHLTMLSRRANSVVGHARTRRYIERHGRIAG